MRGGGGAVHQFDRSSSIALGYREPSRANPGPASQGQLEEKGFLPTPWEVTDTSEINQAVIVQDGGVPRDWGMARASCTGTSIQPEQGCPVALCQAAGRPGTQSSPLKATGPESVALLLNRDSEPCLVVGLVWIRADTLQETQKVLFAF